MRQVWNTVELRLRSQSRDDRLRRVPVTGPRRSERVLVPHLRHWRAARRGGSNALWASFDDAEGRWGSRQRHIEGGYRLGETFQCQAAEVFECDYFFYGRSHATGDQDLAVLRLGTEPSGEVAHGADRGVAGALGKANLAQ